MESVNIRAEQLSDIYSVIPKEQIKSLNKRFQKVSYQFEQYQRPEEKGIQLFPLFNVTLCYRHCYEGTSYDAFVKHIQNMFYHF